MREGLCVASEFRSLSLRRALIAPGSPFPSFISFHSCQCEQRVISTMSGSINPVDEEMSVLSRRSSERIPSPSDQTKSSNDPERGKWEFLQRHVQMMAIGNSLLHSYADFGRCKHRNWVAQRVRSLLAAGRPCSIVACLFVNGHRCRRSHGICRPQ
jgi:hypothetical protein